MTITNHPMLGAGSWTGNTTFTAASAASGHAASNLNELPLAQVWESTSLTGQWVKGEMDKIRPLGLFLLCRHNFTNAGTFRLRIYADAAATQADLVYDSQADLVNLIGGQDIWPISFADELDWEDDPFIDGHFPEEEKQDTVWYRPIVLPRTYLGRSWRLDFTDADNPDGVFRLGMIDVSRSRQLSRAPAAGQADEYEERTTTVTAYGGVDYHNRLTKKRKTTVDLRGLPVGEAKGVIGELYRLKDIDQPFAWLLDPTDVRNWIRDCYLAKFEQLSPLQRASQKYENAQLNMKEAF